MQQSNVVKATLEIMVKEVNKVNQNIQNIYTYLYICI